MQDIELPRENDVLFGRGGGTNHHPGNRRWRQLVEDRKHEYARQSRLEKPMVSQTIIDRWRAQVPAGRFLKKNSTTGFWNDVGDKKAREKTSQALREKSSSSGSHNNNNNNNNNTDEDDAMVQPSYLASLPSLSSLLSVAVESLPSLSSLRSVGVETAVPHHSQTVPSEDSMAALSTTTVPTTATVGAVPNHRRASAAFKRRRKRRTSNENETYETKPHAVKRHFYKNSCSNGRFQKKNTTTGFWNDVGDTKAREKTSQALREKGSSNGGAVITAAVPPSRASTALKRSTSNENESYETKPRAVKRPVYKNSDDIDSSNENESYETKPRAVKRPASSEQDEGSDNVDTTTLTLLSLNNYKNNYDIDSTRHGSNQAVDPIQFSIFTSFTSDGLNRFSTDTKNFCGIDATRQNNDVLTSLALFRNDDNDDNDDNKNKDDADEDSGLNASRERFSSFTSDMYEELLHLDDPIISTTLETNRINDNDAISIPSPLPLSVPFAQTERLTTEDVLEVMMIDDFGRHDDASSCNSLEILRDFLEDEQNTAVDDDYNHFLESSIAADLNTGINNNTSTSKLDNTFGRSSTDCVSNEMLMTYAEHANALTAYDTANDWSRKIALEPISKQQSNSIPHHSTSSSGCIKGGTMPRTTSTGISSERRLLLHERDHEEDRPDYAHKKEFPWLMHRILDDAASKGFEEIISWVSTNNGFKVHNKNVFELKIIPEYFCKKNKYKSFQRSVNMWGFQRVDRDDCPGMEKGSYVHESFIRGNPDLCKNMKRVKIKGNGKGNGKADNNLSPEESKPGLSTNTNTVAANNEAAQQIADLKREKDEIQRKLEQLMRDATFNL